MSDYINEVSNCPRKKNCGDDSIEVVAPNGIEFEYINRVRENRKKLTRKYFNEIYN